jgi:hypothetical protein
VFNQSFLAGFNHTNEPIFGLIDLYNGVLGCGDKFG